MVKEPMLASKTDLVKPPLIRFPVLASPKLDGFRAFVSGSSVYSRKLKLIPNEFVQESFGRQDLHGLDGELIVGSATDPLAFNKTSSGVTRRDGTPDVTFWVFDDYSIDKRFESRIFDVWTRVHWLRRDGMAVRVVKHVVMKDIADLLAYEDRCLRAGFEGVMIRSLDGPYKQGRATAREGWLLKLKRFEDAEATIVGFKEKMHNANPQEVNELGRSKRSSHQANKHALDTLGGLVLRTADGVEFNAPMGAGWTDQMKDDLWRNRDAALGKTVVYKSLPIGVKDKPRFPKVTEVKGFRDISLD